MSHGLTRRKMEKNVKDKNPRVLLLQKIFKVMKAIPELVKTGQMAEGDSRGYAYHEADSIRERFRAELLKQKLLCLPTFVQSDRWGNPTSTGGTFNYSSQNVTFTFFDVDTGESLDCQSVGWGGDSLDKAAPKAAIQALKYFLTNGFFVKGIELDGDSPDEQLAGREANRQHLWFEGKPEASHSEPDFTWIMIDGNRLFCTQKKLRKQIKMWEVGCDGDITRMNPHRFRTYMGALPNNGVNPHPIIDKIEVIEARTDEQQPISAERQPN